MPVAILCLSAVVLVLLVLLIRAGLALERASQREGEELYSSTVFAWPRVILIVPVAGNDPRLGPALTSLLEQDYPNFTPIFVTESAEESCVALIATLQAKYPTLRHVVAGPSSLAGQKNHNVLSAIDSVCHEQFDCYVFCDSTHTAKADFLQSLIQPIVQGRASFTTGYHAIYPADSSWYTLAYAACVLIMRLLQALSVFTQPWGGAMAIKRSVFEQHGIAALWRKTVVDDCALVPLLARVRLRVHLVARALLATRVQQHSREVLEAWMERQILFPKFCVPVQWWLLGVMLVFFFLPPILFVEDLCFALLSGSAKALIWPGLWAVLFFALISQLRRFLPIYVAPTRWFGAFCLALVTFLRVYLRTIGAKHIVWHGKVYTVGRGGVVEHKEP